MYLHKSKEEFLNLINVCSNVLNIDQSIIEKDYYICFMLKTIDKLYSDKNNMHVIFKGGTSLSKCYKIINRFSEDIDISSTVNSEMKNNETYLNVTSGRMNTERFNRCIKEAAKMLDLENIKNELYTHNSYVNFKYSYMSVLNNYNSDIKDYIEIDSVNYLSCYTYNKMKISTYLYEALIKIKNKDNEKEIDKLIKDYDLKAFTIFAQSLERTFIDKVFAICDYYLKDEKKYNARHIYDLYKLLNSKKLSIKKLKMLIPIVREDRSKFKKDNKHYCPSAQKDIDVNQILTEIINSKKFEYDYNDNAIKLFYANEKVEYDEVKKSLNEIIKLKLFK